MNDTLATAALCAVEYTLPLFEMARMRAATAPRRQDNGDFAASDAASTVRWVNGLRHTRELLGPRNREVVSPNNDTLYDNAWLDLSQGPLLIDVPDMGERYWTLGFLDMWTNPFAYAGRRTTGNRAQRLFVHGPSWRGDLPAGAVEIACPGDDVWIIGRMLAGPDAADLAIAHRLQNQYSILRADDSRMPAWQRFETGMDGRDSRVPNADLYQRVVRQVLKRNPAPSSQARMLDLIERFALNGPESQPASAAAQGELERALEKVYAALRAGVGHTDIGNGWTLPIAVRSDYGTDYAKRARVARNLIGALGIEEAMYPVCEVDVQGERLDGRKRYAIRFPPGAGPQVDAFWSLTAYRHSDCLLIENPLRRYSIGDRTQGLRWDPDGGLTLRLQSNDPGSGINWLPTPPDDDFYLTLRLYQPRQAHLALQFSYPSVQPI